VKPSVVSHNWLVFCRSSFRLPLGARDAHAVIGLEGASNDAGGEKNCGPKGCVENCLGRCCSSLPDRYGYGRSSRLAPGHFGPNKTPANCETLVFTVPKASNKLVESDQHAWILAGLLHAPLNFVVRNFVNRCLQTVQELGCKRGPLLLRQFRGFRNDLTKWMSRFFGTLFEWPAECSLRATSNAPVFPCGDRRKAGSPERK